ncbi:hypothetical protein ELUMI_v1c04920 [Williamsoniiplasma luminosum]|uniref:Uncharacterized protein n=1 Tax=Williamsoniiplasma luminosum TaxID=214888 RepID=A0A2K8NUJ9_9MOLU|nr:hypothetical protein [Williamsoniiplasma luminosum]ATZ17216.1 hypothetical protein ELUMI_v1c04920 [Williamsoniiplasma luminosum]
MSKRTRFWIDLYNVEDIELMNLFKANLKQNNQNLQPQIRVIFLQAVLNYLKDGKLLDNLESTINNSINSRNEELKFFNAVTAKKSILDSERRLAKIEANVILLTNLLAKEMKFEDQIEVPKESFLEPFTFQHTIDREMKSEQRNLLANFKKKKLKEEVE